MDWPEYVTARLVEDRLAAYRANAARVRLSRAGRPPRRSPRVAVGLALIRLGSRMVGARLAGSLASPRAARRVPG
jgi:hypothetical protein